MKTALRENRVKHRTPKQQPVLLYLTSVQAINLTILRHGAQGHSLVQSDMWHWASHPLAKLIKSLEDLQHVCYYAKFHHHALFKILITTGMYNCYSQLPSEYTGRNKGFITFPMSHSALTHQDWLGDGMSELEGSTKPGNQPSEERNQGRTVARTCDVLPNLTHFISSTKASDPQETWRRIQTQVMMRMMKTDEDGIMVKIHDEEHEGNSDDQ